MRVRIAPSPTGDPHVGTAYIALFNRVFARHSHPDSRFVLRIEDTDRTRSTPESEAAILRALGWLGLTWDEGPDIGGPFGPYRQSERTAIYTEHAGLLIERGRAYRCFCTAERLAEVRAQQLAAKKTPGYDGHCRALAPADAAARAAAGETHVVRLAMPETGNTTFVDRLRGEITIANEQVDDQVLLKSDGFPTYHLANVVDDHLMQITHVIRAEEWLSSTPKHVVLYDAFGWTAPEWIHMPLLRNLDKSKISKRKNPVSIDYYRDAGILPEVLVNFLGLMGWSFGNEREKFTLAEMEAAFTWDKISLGGPVFDVDKLGWLNGLYLRELTVDQFIDRLKQWRLGDAHLRTVIPLVKERVRRLDEFFPYVGYCFSGELPYAKLDDSFAQKSRKELADRMLEFLDKLEEDRAARTFQSAELGRALEAFVAEKQLEPPQRKELFSHLRLAVTNAPATPPLTDVMATLGLELVRFRIRAYVKHLLGKK